MFCLDNVNGQRNRPDTSAHDAMSNQEDSPLTTPPTNIEHTELVEPSHDALIARLSAGKGRKYVRFVIAALGSIPGVGGFIAASASLSAEREQQSMNELQRMWLEEHKEKIRQLSATLADIFVRLDNFGDEIEQRIESPEYLALVRKGFRSWDEADTEEKKQMFKKLITNAGAIKLCPDDLVRLFLHWIEQYDETHFIVMKEIYRHSHITRAQLWDNIHGPRPREDSSEADLFRYLIRDLSTRWCNQTSARNRHVRSVPEKRYKRSNASKPEPSHGVRLREYQTVCVDRAWQDIRSLRDGRRGATNWKCKLR